MMRALALVPLVALFCFRAASAQEDGRVIPIWPEGVPGAKPDGGERRIVDGRVYNVQVPTLTFRAPQPGHATGSAVIICPGGGYARLAIGNEGSAVSDRLHALGVATFVLDTASSSTGTRRRSRTSCARSALCDRGPPSLACGRIASA